MTELNDFNLRSDELDCDTDDADDAANDNDNDADDDDAGDADAHGADVADAFVLLNLAQLNLMPQFCFFDLVSLLLPLYWLSSADGSAQHSTLANGI